jgi:hypothetical protein
MVTSTAPQLIEHPHAWANAGISQQPLSQWAQDGCLEDKPLHLRRRMSNDIFRLRYLVHRVSPSNEVSFGAQAVTRRS